MSKQTYLNDREFRRQLKQLLKECTQANSKTIPALRKIGFQVLRHSKHYILRISRNGKTCQYSLSVSPSDKRGALNAVAEICRGLGIKSTR